MPESSMTLARKRFNPRSPGRPRSDASRSAILKAAYQILREGGFAGFTVEGVAARAGAGKATIYRWWQTKGKLAIVVKNPGNRHFRLTKLTISDEAGFQKEVSGWYSLAGTERTYTADIPRDVCRKARAFNVLVEGEEGLRFDRKLHVDPAGCA